MAKKITGLVATVEVAALLQDVQTKFVMILESNEATRGPSRAEFNERMDVVDERLTRLEIGQTLMSRDMLYLKTSQDQIAENVSGLKTDVSDLKADMSGVKADVSGLKADVSDLKTDMSGVKADVSGLKADVSDIKADVSDIKIDVLDIKADVLGLKAGQVRIEAQLTDVVSAVKRHDTEIIKLWSAVGSSRRASRSTRR